MSGASPDSPESQSKANLHFALLQVLSATTHAVMQRRMQEVLEGPDPPEGIWGFSLDGTFQVRVSSASIIFDVLDEPRVRLMQQSAIYVSAISDFRAAAIMIIAGVCVDHMFDSHARKQRRVSSVPESGDHTAMLVGQVRIKLLAPTAALFAAVQEWEKRMGVPSDGV